MLYQKAIDEGTVKETTPPVASIPPAAVVSDDIIPVVTQSAVPTEFNEPVATDRVVEQPTVSATDTHTALDPSEVQNIVDLLPKVKGSGAPTGYIFLTLVSNLSLLMCLDPSFVSIQFTSF